MKQLPRLDNWIICTTGIISWAEGNVYKSPRFIDGEYISTSWLRRYSLAEGLVTTRNSTYLLGKPRAQPPKEEDVPVK
jgi:hypothetical protein